jgi:hypothetical protein
MITDQPNAFAEALPHAGRLLGLDVGTKTIGTAVCDAGWTIASPAELIHRAKFSADADKIAALATSQGVTGLVIGLPLNLDGSDSPRTQSVRAFARNIGKLGPPHSVVGRTLVDAGRHPHADRRRRQPGTPRRAGRQDGRRLHSARGDRCPCGGSSSFQG